MGQGDRGPRGVAKRRSLCVGDVHLDELPSVVDGRVNILVGVSSNCTARIRAGELVNHLANQVGGKGGGRPDLAQAAGDRPEALDDALDGFTAWLKGQL